MIAIKLPYQTSQEDKNIIFKYQKNQNNIIKFIFNRFKDAGAEVSGIEIRKQIKDLNNIFIDSWMIESSIFKARELFSSSKENNSKVIFGGRKLFLQRCQNKITKQEFQFKKISPLYLVGERLQKGNRKVALDIKNNKILLKFNRETHIELTLPNLKKNLKQKLFRLEELMNKKLIPMTFSINQEFLYLSFEEIQNSDIIKISKKQNRIMALDLNPNFIGFSILDWVNEEKFNIVKTGMISVKEINDKEFNIKNLKYELKKQEVSGEARKQIFNKKYSHIKNKRKHEIVEVAKQLYNIAKSHNIEYFSIEELNIKPRDNQKGRRYNRLINNNWNRNLLEQQLEKRLKIIDIKMLRILPQYSSVIGNLVYRNLRLPDPILSSIEINRRTFKFVGKFIKKVNSYDRIVLPSFKSLRKIVSISLEEIGYKLKSTILNWKDLNDWMKEIKTLNLRYRVSLAEAKPPASVLSLKSSKSLVKVFEFC